LPQIGQLTSCKKLILSKTYQPSIAFFIAKNGSFHQTIVHQPPGEAGSFDEGGTLNGGPPGLQEKFVKFFTI
jgi:hypothetical protein